MIQEHIALGQRVRKFEVEALQNGEWQSIASGTTVGYKRILPVKGISTTALRVRFIDSRGPLTIARVAAY